MELTGERTIPVPRQQVWEGLNSPEVLAACIEGCESMTWSGENTLTATVRMKIGPLSAKFSGTVTLSEIDPPNGCVLTGKGQGGAAGFAQGGARVELEETGPAETVLRYTATATVGGKLASVGARLVQGVAAQTADRFFDKFAAHLAAAAPPPAEDIAPEEDLPLPADHVVPVASHGELLHPPAPAPALVAEPAETPRPLPLFDPQVVIIGAGWLMMLGVLALLFLV